MTPEEARNLLGGYATGSLTEAERTALFEAALDDQDLFDELAGEQVLKEVLDEPGARQRLLDALDPAAHRAGWWLRPWTWTAAAVTLAIAIVLVVSSRNPTPQQIAQVVKSPQPAAEPIPSPPPQPRAVQRKVSPAPPASPPPAPLKTEKGENKLADQAQQAKPQAAGAVREFAAARAPAVFAFNYALGVDRVLEIVPAAPGFLSVTASDAVIFASAAVGAGTPVRIPIPADAISLTIGFSRQQGTAGTPVRRDEASGTVTDQDPPNGRIATQLFLKPATQ